MNQFGLADNNGKIIIKPEYKEILSISEDYKAGYIVIDESDKYGVIDFSKNIVLSPEYDQIMQVELTDMYVVSQDGILKLINNKKETILEDNFDEIKANGNKDEIIYKNNGKYGIINKNGIIQVENTYDDLEYVFSNYYIAKKDNKYGVIKSDNNESVLGFEYSKIEYILGANIFEIEKTGDVNTTILNSEFEEKLKGIISEMNVEKGYMRVRVNNEYKYYNFKFEEKNASDILTDNTIFLSKKNEKYGFIDKKGNIIVDYIYDDATEQNKYGYAAIKKDGKWGAINLNGEIVVEPKYDLNDNLIIDFIGKWHLSVDLNAYYYTDKQDNSFLVYIEYMFNVLYINFIGIWIFIQL